MQTTALSDRIARFASELANSGFDAWVGTTQTAMGYLQGVFENGHERFFGLFVNKDGRSHFICPALSATQLTRHGITDFTPWVDGQDPMDLIKNLTETWNLRSAVIGVDDDMRAAFVLQLQELLPAALFKPASGVLARLQRTKSADELQKMERAAQIADQAYLELLGWAKPGQTEAEVCRFLDDSMARQGGGVGFSCTAAGPNGAEPHHISDETRLKQGDVVVVDFGCTFEGYKSDITRMFSLGPASEKAKEIYGIVYAAHMAARGAIAPGASGAQVDRAARDVIENAGYGEFFLHRTGHGIGMQVHEAPNIVSTNTEPLMPGDCFSIEPGIYLPGQFGVRIENIVTATETGHRSLNAEPEQTLREV